MIPDSPKLVSQLEKSVLQNRVGSAYLIFGSLPEERKQQAILFAKRLNCEKETTCNSCFSCSKIDRSIHPDVHVIERGENDEESFKIDRLRELQKHLHLKPYEGKWKVVILSEAQELSLVSSNSLLKILEEPPRITTFVLLSPHVENLLSTIISRCQLIRLPTPVEISLSKPDFLNDILSLPSKLDQLFALAKKISEDEAVLKNTLEILLVWYHDLLFYKQNLIPPLSPLQEKETLGQVMSRKYPMENITEKLNAIMDAKKNLRFQINRELLVENLFLKLTQ